MSKRLRFVVRFTVSIFVLSSALYFLLGYSNWWVQSLYLSLISALVADTGYGAGNTQGHTEGYEKGYKKGYDTGHCAGYEEGHSIGYSTAKNNQQESNETTWYLGGLAFFINLCYNIINYNFIYFNNAIRQGG